MSDAGMSRPELITLLVKASVIGVFSYLAFKWTIEALDPTRKQKKEAQEKVCLFAAYGCDAPQMFLILTNVISFDVHFVRLPVYFAEWE